MPERSRRMLFVAFLAFCSAISALAIDSSLPAFEPIRHAFGTSLASAGYTLTVFMLTFAITQPIFGAASQRFGRRPVLIFGCALFGACGFGCATSGSIGELLAWRAAQGVGASACAVLVFAIVRDRFSGDEARALMANVGATMMIAPMIAPSLGALVMTFASWRGIFVYLGIAGALLLAIVLAFFRESIAARDPLALVPSHFLAVYGRIATNRTSCGYAAIAGLSFGGMFAYIAGSSTLFIDELGATPRLFGALFAITSVAIVGGNVASNAFVARNVSYRVALATGLSIAIVSSTALVVLSAAHALSIPAAVPILALNTFSIGIIAPNAAHGVLEAVPDIAGPASAVIGSGRVLCGAIASFTVASLSRFGAAGMGSTMATFAALSIVIYVTVVRPADGDVRARLGRARA